MYGPELPGKLVFVAKQPDGGLCDFVDCAIREEDGRALRLSPWGHTDLAGVLKRLCQAQGRSSRVFVGGHNDQLRGHLATLSRKDHNLNGALSLPSGWIAYALKALDADYNRVAVHPYDGGPIELQPGDWLVKVILRRPDIPAQLRLPDGSGLDCMAYIRSADLESS